MLWKRLRDYQQKMHVHKALLLTEYLIANGSDRFVRDARHKADDIHKLRRYQFYDKNNVDQAEDIRKIARRVHETLMNEEKLKSAREKAAALKNIRTSHVSNRSASPRRSGSGAHSPRSPRSNGAASPRRVATSDPYDLYSNTSRKVAYEEASSPRNSTSTPSKAKADENPFGDSPADVDPFSTPAAEEKKKKKKHKKDKKHDKHSRKSSKKSSGPRQPSFGEDDFSAAFGDAPADPFAPEPKKPAATRRVSVTDALDEVFGPDPSASQYTKPAASQQQDFDFLTGGFEAINLNDDPFNASPRPDDGANGSDDGRVVWGPDNIDDTDSDDEPQPQSGDIWDIGAGFTSVDNLNEDKKRNKEQQKAKKKNKAMSDMAAQRGRVIQGQAITGFEAPQTHQQQQKHRSQPQQPANNDPFGMMYNQPAPAQGYGQQPAYGYPPQQQAPPQAYGNPFGGPAYGAPQGQPQPYGAAPAYNQGYGAPPPAQPFGYGAQPQVPHNPDASKYGFDMGPSQHSSSQNQNRGRDIPF